jgi:D-arabinose 1-dehydrogenase-like Zn-dependent alcohol dehydrogenase
MCAGFTVYTLMIRHSMNQPSKSLGVGVIGLGGLGHMDFKFGKAFWLKVTVFRRVNRRELKPLISSDNFVISFDEKQMEVYIVALDLLISELSSNSLIVISSSIFCYYGQFT